MVKQTIQIFARVRPTKKVTSVYSVDDEEERWAPAWSLSFPGTWPRASSTTRRRATYSGSRRCLIKRPSRKRSLSTSPSQWPTTGRRCGAWCDPADVKNPLLSASHPATERDRVFSRMRSEHSAVGPSECVSMGPKRPGPAADRYRAFS
ncbi:hypothetical protein COCON_G00018440 [Conger conger]|uniref:Uncharacterized protein n=1 Tax=Conger conger TaxID=82655 RepID=A0A9Q1I9P5_CONCO|nr:hypothetical protein COCON_G00018440 [Conger conger]